MKTKIDPKTAKEIIKLVECLRLGKDEVILIYRKIYNHALDDVIKVVRESTNDQTLSLGEDKPLKASDIFD